MVFSETDLRHGRQNHRGSLERILIPLSARMPWKEKGSTAYLLPPSEKKKAGLLLGSRLEGHEPSTR